MPYNDNVPQVSQSLGQTQSDINTNFNLIQSTISVNHFPISAANAGKHTIAEFINQNSPITAASESTIYANSVSGVSNLFFRPEGQGVANAGPTYQLTRAYDAKIDNFGTNIAYGLPPAGYTQVGGWTFLPGNLILMYGAFTSTVSNNTGTSVAFPFPFPSGNPPFNIQVSIYKSSLVSLIIDNSVAISSSGFKYLIGTSTNYVLYWTAIGN